MIKLFHNIIFGGLIAAKKLSNADWAEYFKKFNYYNGEITVKDFCIQNDITKSQFYCYKKRLDEGNIETSESIFYPINFNNSENDINISSIREIKINIGNATIMIPVSETTLISSIITELSNKY